ncbi:hypothetical protein FSP39_004990 [Pinctada imbricata]|uniref:Chromo domain-containing protein n=1 Tax=Pinctada imbricata TaxID=66713 RepID=A0AA88XZ93_PINIB|nr:hypothetical protein FSP39_004990 [Pinctada imbricata]
MAGLGGADILLDENHVDFRAIFRPEKVIDVRLKEDRKEYLIKWKGRPESEGTWYYENNLNCPVMIKRFEARRRKSNSTAKKRKAADDKSIDSEQSDKSSSKNGEKSSGMDGSDGEDTEESSNEKFSVSKILDMRTIEGKTEYYLKWKNFPDTENSWEPAENIDSPELLEEFLKTRAANHGPKKKKKPNKESNTSVTNGSVSSPEQEKYVVEKILDNRVKNGKTEYLIKWKNYHESENTWEPEENIEAVELLARYKKKVHSATKAERFSKLKKKLEQIKSRSPDREEKKEKSPTPTTEKSPAAEPKLHPSSHPEKFVVERVLEEREKDGRKEYFLKWRGYPHSDNTWEPAENVDCPDLIRIFYSEKKRKEKSEGKNSSKSASKAGIESEEPDLTPERILGLRLYEGRKEYYVKWKNFPESDNTWEIADTLDCPDLVAKFIKDMISDNNNILQKVLQINNSVKKSNAVQKTSSLGSPDKLDLSA